MTLQSADFKSAASTLPPPGRDAESTRIALRARRGASNQAAACSYPPAKIGLTSSDLLLSLGMRRVHEQDDLPFRMAGPAVGLCPRRVRERE